MSEPGEIAGENPKDRLGSLKCPVGLVPPSLVVETAPAMALGAQKYGAYNWREKRVRFSVYLEAALRHLFALQDREDRDPETGVRHDASVAACIAIIMDARAMGNLVDDRPPAGACGQLITAQTIAQVETDSVR